MKVSELTLPVVKQYIRVDGDEDNLLIESMLNASIVYATSYTGLTQAELDDYEDITLAILALIAELYDVRQSTVSNVVVNPTTLQILGSHSCNLI